MVVVCGVLALAATAVAEPQFSEGRCAFSSPALMGGERVRWAGVCVDEVAQGLGVLRAYRQSTVERFFFGRFRDGKPELGVVDQSDGYVAGHFRDGAPVRSDERQDTLDAFREAAAAAQAFSAYFAARGNDASARFYADKARQLREQMD